MKNRFNSKKPLILGIFLVLLIAVGALGYTARHRRQTNTPSGSSGYYNPATANANSHVPGGSGRSTAGISSPKGGGSGGAASPNGVTPTKPVGTFVSNHRPNLGANPAPNKESSTCTTTPGVRCTITFTMGSIVKSLPEQQTDSNGNAYWIWALQEIGLTAGSWKVSAVAHNGSLSSSSDDATMLEVQP